MCLALKSKAGVEKACFMQFWSFTLQNIEIFLHNLAIFMFINIYKKCACKYIKIISKCEKIVCKYLLEFQIPAFRVFCRTAHKLTSCPSIFPNNQFLNMFLILSIRLFLAVNLKL